MQLKLIACSYNYCIFLRASHIIFYVFYISVTACKVWRLEL